MIKRLALFILIMSSYFPLAIAGGVCHGTLVNPITDVCWSCLFPITIGEVEVFKNHDVPDNSSNPSNPACYCANPFPHFGISTGFWEPVALVDVTRTPFCLVNLGGTQLNLGDSFGYGEQETANSSQNISFYNVHYYRYPLLFWLKVITSVLCLESGELDIAYVSELDPLWNDEEWGFISNPEAIIFGNPAAQIACAADSLKSSLTGPIDSLFWCAGAQGSIYPLTGTVQEHVGGVQASVLLSERMVYKMHRQGLMLDSVGENAPAICMPKKYFITPKSRYRYQMVNPIPTTGRGGCSPFGSTTTRWEWGHEFPFKGEDFGYLIWKKRNCCAG